MTTATTVELRLGGMTCASCAARIEKRLNKLDGVEARVNYATETATVTTADVPTDVLIAAVEAVGYTATLPITSTGADAAAPAVEDEHDVRMRALRDRLLACTLLTLPVLALSMIPRLQFVVHHDGRPVDDLQEYLGALGHLVALRDGDLAYLHVHPDADSLSFDAEFPTPGTYRLFLQFRHGGEVRTAAFTVAIEEESR
jgi:cation transport ATPase